MAALSPFTPKRTCGAIGHSPTPIARCFVLTLATPLQARAVDGTDAEYVTARGIGQHLTRQWLERTGGQLILHSARFPDRIALTVQAYQPGAENTKPALRELAARTLAEFGLTGEID